MRPDDRREDAGTAGGSMRALNWIGFGVLALLTLLLAVLTLGSYAGLNPNAPLWLRSVGTLGALLLGQGVSGAGKGFGGAVALTLLTSLLVGVTVYFKPRG